MIYLKALSRYLTAGVAGTDAGADSGLDAGTAAGTGVLAIEGGLGCAGFGPRVL